MTKVDNKKKKSVDNNLTIKPKRYELSCVEEGIMNPKYEGLRQFRIEVFDRLSDSCYQVYEGTIRCDSELCQKLYDLLDGYETDSLDLWWLNFYLADRWAA
jgi:hypothetical protein